MQVTLRRPWRYGLTDWGTNIDRLRQGAGMWRVRNAALNGYVDLAEAIGLNPHRLMQHCGIDPGTLTVPMGWIDARSVDDLLELTAEESGLVDIGLRLASSRGLSNLGPVGLVAREEPDVRSAIGIVLRHMNLHNEAIRLRISEAAGLATLIVEPAPEFQLGRQSVQLIVASVNRILAELLPDEWKPVAFHFTHEAPGDLSLLFEELGATIYFSRNNDGLIVSARDLDRPNLHSNPLLRPFAQEYLEMLAPSPSSTLVLQVRDLISTLLPTQNCSASRVARSLGMDRRTLHRRLAISNETYSSLLDSVRRDLAEKAIRQGASSYTELAVRLGFSELSAFSRWFRQHFGTSPSGWAAMRPGKG